MGLARGRGGLRHPRHGGEPRARPKPPTSCGCRPWSSISTPATSPPSSTICMRHLGAPTLIVESGGRTPEGAAQAACLVEAHRARRGRGHRPCSAACAATSPSRSAATRISARPTSRSGWPAASTTRAASSAGADPSSMNAALEVDLADFAEAVADMPPLPGVSAAARVRQRRTSPRIDDVLITPVREGAQDDWSRFAGRQRRHRPFHPHGPRGPDHRRDEGWEAICGYNAAMLRPSWPLERLTARGRAALVAARRESNGPPLIRLDAPAPAPRRCPPSRLGALLDDASPMPEDIIAPRAADARAACWCWAARPRSARATS